ncbi:MAG TPA: hypothetical protein VMU50_20570 [Polyangia bacterium]|nr:hypothetical protein [Polyangia bacterium]
MGAEDITSDPVLSDRRPRRAVVSRGNDLLPSKQQQVVLAA